MNQRVRDKETGVIYTVGGRRLNGVDLTHPGTRPVQGRWVSDALFARIFEPVEPAAGALVEPPAQEPRLTWHVEDGDYYVGISTLPGLLADGRTYESALRHLHDALESYFTAGALVEPPAQEPKASRIASTDDSERKRVAERLGELSDRLLVVSKAAKDIDAIRQDLHMFYAEEVAELVEAAAGALVEPPKAFVAPGEFNTAEHWPARQVAALVAREPLEQLIADWRSRAIHVDGSTTCVNGAFYACADELDAVLRAAVPPPAPGDPSCTVPASLPAETPMISTRDAEKPNDSTRTHSVSAQPGPDPEAP